jgi:hypothetical protein
MRLALALLAMITLTSCTHPLAPTPSPTSLPYTTQFFVEDVRRDRVMPPEGLEYFRQVNEKILSKWKPGLFMAGYKTGLVMDINQNGYLTALYFEQRSGNSAFDDLVFSAAASCNPFPEAPPSFEISPARVHYIFSYKPQ